MTALVRDAADGALDKNVTKVMLNTMLLFFVVSYVKLSDGTVGKVLRANVDDHK